MVEIVLWGEGGKGALLLNVQLCLLLTEEYDASQQGLERHLLFPPYTLH